MKIARYTMCALLALVMTAATALANGPPIWEIQDHPEQPWQVSGILVMEDGFAAVSGDIATVPAGKLFVIDYMTSEWIIPAGQEPTQSGLIISLTGSGTMRVRTLYTRQQSEGLDWPRAHWFIAQKVRLYATDTIHFTCQRTAGEGRSPVSIQLVGHLVDID